jgi:hypothetical protein
MSASEWIGMLSAIAAFLAAGFAAWELRRGLLDRRAQEAAHRNGVAVMWLPLIRPNRADASGDGTWTYQITVQNPGPLPILDVVVTLSFTTDVHRRHYDRSVDQPVRELTLHQPVVLAHGERTWKRTVVVPFEHRDALRKTSASVAFKPVDQPRQTNYMDGRPPSIEQQG